MDLNEPDLKSPGKLKSTPTVNECSPSTGRMSSDTGISELSTGQLFPEWMCSAVDFPAKTLALLESEPGLTANAQGSGVNTSEPFAHFDRATSSWRTSQVCLLTNTWDVFSETWPRAGTMRNGIAYRQVPLAPLTDVTECGLLPTMRSGHGAVGALRKPEAVQRAGGHRGRIEDYVTLWPTPASNNGTGGCTGLAGGSGNRKKLYAMLGEEEGKKLGCQSLNPYWVEWLMGYPIGWTDLGDSATPLFRKSRNGSDGK